MMKVSVMHYASPAVDPIEIRKTRIHISQQSIRGLLQAEAIKMFGRENREWRMHHVPGSLFGIRAVATNGEVLELR